MMTWAVWARCLRCCSLPGSHCRAILLHRRHLQARKDYAHRQHPAVAAADDDDAVHSDWATVAVAVAVVVAVAGAAACSD